MKTKGVRKITIICWLLMLLLMAGVSVQADEIVERGSIALQLPQNAEGVELTLYSVAEYRDGVYLYEEAFADSGIVISDLNDAEQVQKAAESLAAFALEKKIPGETGKADESGLLLFSGLDHALYLAAQTAGEELLEVQPVLVPIPFRTEEGEVYDAVLSPKYTFPGGAVIADKVDENGTSVADARFVLQQKRYLKEGETAPEGTETETGQQGAFYWKEFQKDLISDEHGQIVVYDLPMGEYRLVETGVPEGFIREPQTAYFTISGAGTVERAENGLYGQAAGKVELLEVVNRQTSLMVNKVDSEGNAVPGAKLVIKDAEGRVIRDEDGKAKYMFVTTEEPHELKRLPAGEYYLCEVQSPDGYQIAKDIRLTVSDEADAVNVVTMVDEREVPGEGSLRVRKTLTDIDGMELAAREGSFYVALFQDEERTVRVSDVKEITYQNSSTGTAVFPNLKLDTPYYVGETTEYGELLEGGQENGVFYTPVYGDTYGVTLTEQVPSSEIEFQNVFVDVPDGYYYVGELTVTKKVLKGGQPWDSQETYYAGIFEDRECTQLYEEQVLVLSMDGGSETSVTVPVYLGESPDTSRTYYVAETDENGVPLTNGDSLEFVIAVDKTEVTLGGDKTEENVTITNTLKEITPVASVTPTQTPSGGKEPPASGTTGSGPVKTGDSTPVLQLVVLLLTAAALIIALLFRRRSSGRK